MQCRQCNVPKDAADFYAGNKSRCKECIKESVRANRLDKIDYYRAFDRARGSQPHRVAARAEYAQTEAGKAAHRAANERYAANNPNAAEAKRRYAISERGKAKKQEWVKSEAGKMSAKLNTKSQRVARPDRNRARVILNNAVRDAKVIPWPVCAVPDCSCKPQAHHPDYSRPLDVVWLCVKHHKEVHALARKAA